MNAGTVVSPSLLHHASCIVGESVSSYSLWRCQRQHLATPLVRSPSPPRRSLANEKQESASSESESGEGSATESVEASRSGATGPDNRVWTGAIAKGFGIAPRSSCRSWEIVSEKKDA